jgi:hypothetical protein
LAGIGAIPRSGWRLSERYRDFDAEYRFDVRDVHTAESSLCRSGEVLQGLIKPHDCGIRPGRGVGLAQRDRPRRHFEGAWAYLEFLASVAGVDDPLDVSVVSAYWVGGPLPAAADPGALLTFLGDRFAGQIGGTWRSAAGRASAHHSFHEADVAVEGVGGDASSRSIRGPGCCAGPAIRPPSGCSTAAASGSGRSVRSPAEPPR